MSRAARLDLRSFQRELASRLASKTAAQVESSRLGVASANGMWLIRLPDAGEVIAVPPIVPVPLTKRWFLGLANIRGNLHGVVDFPAFLGAAPVAMGSAARLELLARGTEGGDSAGIVVERVLGLRNLAQFEPLPQDTAVPAWHVARWQDGEGRAWQEIDLALLARDPAFLQVGA
jgi:twitching motility protein PilI